MPIEFHINNSHLKSLPEDCWEEANERNIYRNLKAEVWTHYISFIFCEFIKVFFFYTKRLHSFTFLLSLCVWYTFCCILLSILFKFVLCVCIGVTNMIWFDSIWSIVVCYKQKKNFNVQFLCDGWVRVRNSLSLSLSFSLFVIDNLKIIVLINYCKFHI